MDAWEEQRFCVGEAGAVVRLIQADCLEVLPALLEPGAVDVVITSPPYNLGIGYKGFDDAAPRDAYLEWTDRWAAAVARVLSPQGSFFLNIAGKPSDPWGPFDVLQVMRRHFRLQNTIHWIKSIAIPESRKLSGRDEDIGNYPGWENDLVVGHYKPINSARYLNDCQEYVFHLTHQGDVALDRLAIGVPYRDKSNVTRWRAAGGDLHCRGNTWFIPYSTIQRRDRDRPHPATFPPRLAEMCMRLHGLSRKRSGLALDPFLGLGSAALAAARLEVPFLGMEISPTYYREAVQRLREALARTGRKLSG
ncbi:MAG: site-specific DNA-methyltransferase [Armatimonadetes bacterium]|nr:site-specific DNA-methyltransferase [Armatimonadota bacterium]